MGVLLLLLTVFNSPQADTDNLAAIKTGFIYNFFRFIQWPDTGTSYRLCSAATSDLESVLLTLENKLVNQKPIHVSIRVESNALKNCDLIFIDSKTALQPILAAIHDLPILTVGDHTDFIEQGGMIELTEFDNRLAYELNLDTAKASGLQISAQMLKLAKTVINTP